MTFSTSCRRCGADYDINRGHIAGGHRWWSLCPDCRQADADELPPVATDSDPVTADS
jgi:hypothetical protein